MPASCLSTSEPITLAKPLAALPKSHAVLTCSAMMFGIRSVLFGLIAMMTCACASAPKRTTLMEHAHIEATSRQVRSRVNDLALHYSIGVQRIADDIQKQSDDPVIRRNALQWKIDAVGAGSVAFFRADPFVALIDAWALTVQMRQFFEGDAGKATFGEYASLAVQGCRKLEAEFRALYISLQPQLKDARQGYLEEWAKAHPIKDLRLSRDSIEPLLMKLTAKDSQSLMSAAGSMPEIMEDVTHQSHFYTWFLPKHARMEAELLIDDVATRPEVKQALLTMQTFAELSKELTTLLKDARTGFDENQHGFFGALENQKQSVFGEVNKQRLETLADLRNERDILLGAMHNERVAAMKDGEKIALGAVDEGIKRSYALIDHVFLRAVEMCVAFAVLALLAWFAIVRPELRRKPSRPLTPVDAIISDEKPSEIRSGQEPPFAKTL